MNTPAETAALHAVILQTLRAVGEIGRPADRLITDLRMATFAITLPSLETELRILVDEKRWVAEMPQSLGASRYRITPRGASVLEEQGL